MSNSFLETLDMSGVEYHVSDSNPNEINICCVFCFDMGETEDERFRLGINTSKNFGHCYNCEWSSKNNTIEKVLDKLNLDKDIKHVKKLDIKKEFDGEMPESFELLFPLKKDKDFQKAYNYLKARRVSDRQISKHKIGFCLAGKYFNRIIFPVFVNKKLTCFMGRDFTGKSELRYLNSEGSKTIYGLPKHKAEVALLLEGAFDKLAAERVLEDVDTIGIPGRVLQDKDVELLKGYKKIIRVPDDDRPGLNGAMKDIKKLQAAGIETWISFLDTTYKDTSSAFCKGDTHAINKLVTKAKIFGYSEQIKLRTMISTDYRGARELHG